MSYAGTTPLLRVRSRARLMCLLAVATCAAACSSSESSSGSGGPTASTTPTEPGKPADGANGGGAAAPAKPYADFDVNHVLGTGQSLSLGAQGAPPLSVTQPYQNMMFDIGLEPVDAQPSRFVPLVENAKFLGIPVETMSSSFANLATRLAETAQKKHDVLVTLHGVSGASYPQVGKGTAAFKKGIDQVRAAKAIAEAEGKTYTVRAVTAVHGESDGWENWNKEYANALVEWQAAYDSEIKDVTGQTADVPMFHSQYSAWSAVESTPSNIIPFLQLEAAKRAPGKVVIVGPKYMLPYAPDGLHLKNEGYRWLGEYYAKAYTRHVIEGKPWEPLRPKQISRAGNVITVSFIVPAPPLVLDTQVVTNPGNFGFEVADENGAPAPIAKVEVTGADTVTITLANALSGSNNRLRYAYSATPDKSGGPTEGPRGNLRDSDATQSRYGYSLFDWCVHFDEPMP